MWYLYGTYVVILSVSEYKHDKAVAQSIFRFRQSRLLALVNHQTYPTPSVLQHLTLIQYSSNQWVLRLGTMLILHLFNVPIARKHTAACGIVVVTLSIVRQR